MIEITDDDEHEWIERIGKTASEICNDPSRNRIKLNKQDLSWNQMILQYWAVLVELSNNI